MSCMDELQRWLNDNLLTDRPEFTCLKEAAFDLAKDIDKGSRSTMVKVMIKELGGAKNHPDATKTIQDQTNIPKDVIKIIHGYVGNDDPLEDMLITSLLGKAVMYDKRKGGKKQNAKKLVELFGLAYILPMVRMLREHARHQIK